MFRPAGETKKADFVSRGGLETSWRNKKGHFCVTRRPEGRQSGKSALQCGHVARIVDVLALHGVEVIQQAGVMLLNLTADYLHG